MLICEQQYEVAPYPILNLTSEILAFLKPLPIKPLQGSEGRASKMMKEQFNRLPVELQDEIYCHLYPFVNPPLECTRQLSSDVWRTFLFRGNIFPWLWDLDASALKGSRQGCSERDYDGDYYYSNLPAYGADNYWDWEQLVRQLAQVEAFETGHPMEHAPFALRNRRRIWRILDEARMDDVHDYAMRKLYEAWGWDM
jgi:hypothetical protein